jgi:hypothetical protein
MTSTFDDAASTSVTRPARVPFPVAAAVAATAVGVVGLLMPWAALDGDLSASDTSEAMNGFGEDFFGPVVLAALVVGLLGVVAAVKARFVALTTLVGAAVVVLLAVAGNAKVGRTQDAAEALIGSSGGDAVTTGLGVWVTLAAGVALFVAGLLALRKRR